VFAFRRFGGGGGGGGRIAEGGRAYPRPFVALGGGGIVGGPCWNDPRLGPGPAFEGPDPKPDIAPGGIGGGPPKKGSLR
jgi:hypothetical protein